MGRIILRAQSQAANGAGTFSLTKRIPGTLKPSPPPPPPALVPDDRPTPDKVITENKGPSSNSPPPGTRRGRGTSTKSDDKKAPEDIISSKIKFGPSSNAVLEGWDEIWRITVLLKNDPNLKITVSASAGYAKGEYKNEKETPTGFFGPVMNTASNVINEVTGLQKIGTTGGGTTGELIDIRGQRIKKALIDNGISPDRISTERGGMYPTPDGRTVKFSFKKI